MLSPSFLRDYVQLLAKTQAVRHPPGDADVTLLYAINNSIQPAQFVEALSEKQSALTLTARTWAFGTSKKDLAHKVAEMAQSAPAAEQAALRRLRDNALTGVHHWTPEMSALISPPGYECLSVGRGCMFGTIQARTYAGRKVRLLDEVASSLETIYLAGTYWDANDTVYIPTYFQRAKTHTLCSRTPSEELATLEREYCLTALHEFGEREVATRDYPDFLSSEDRFLLLATPETEELPADLYMLEQVSTKEEHERRAHLALLALDSEGRRGLDGALMRYALLQPDPHATYASEIRRIVLDAKVHAPGTPTQRQRFPLASESSFRGVSAEDYARMPVLSPEKLSALERKYGLSRTRPGS